MGKPRSQEDGVQAPRDVSEGSEGKKAAAFEPLNQAQRAKLVQTNVHFHLGAEHYSQGQYDQKSNDRRLATDGDVAAGYMCDTTGYNTDAYEFQYCKNVKVGETYEIHYPYSSAGAVAAALDDDVTSLSDGLGSAANGRSLLNPFLVVQGQVFFIVNDDNYYYDDMVHGWQTGLAAEDSVMYAGSTTGPSHTNEVCSPYAVSWHVDRKCHPVSAKAFDKMCQDMKTEYDMYADTYPHGSRILLDKAFVVPWSEVQTLG